MSSALSVYGGQDGPRTTLREHWERQVVERELDRGAPYDWKTKELYLQTVGMWERLMGDLPIEAIGQADVDAFLVRLRAQPGRRAGTLAQATVRKHASNLRAMLGAGQAAVTKGVKVRLPRRERMLAFGHFTIDEIGLMMQAGTYLRSPRPEQIGCSTEDWWRCLIAWMYCTGSRLEESLLMKWAYIRDDMVEIPGVVRKLGIPHQTYLHARLIELLKPLRERGTAEIFDWNGRFATDGPKRRNAMRALARSHNAAMAFFGIRKVAGVAFHGYRKTHLSELAMISPIAAELSSSHGGNSLLTRHYLDTPRILRSAIAQLPFPGSAPAPSGTGG